MTLFIDIFRLVELFEPESAAGRRSVPNVAAALASKEEGDHMKQSPVQKETTEASKRQYCCFRISRRLYGVNILEVKEISPVVDFTPIFHAPQGIKGYVNIRGQIYLLLDLRLILGFEAQEIDSSCRSVLFRSEWANLSPSWWTASTIFIWSTNSRSKIVARGMTTVLIMSSGGEPISPKGCANWIMNC
jgi:hypothetical protein